MLHVSHIKISDIIIIVFSFLNDYTFLKVVLSPLRVASEWNLLIRTLGGHVVLREVVLLDD